MLCKLVLLLLTFTQIHTVQPMVAGNVECGLIGKCQGELEHLEEGIASENDCLSMCQSSQDCSWFTYNHANGKCFLYKTCPTLGEACNVCNTGQKECLLQLQKILIATGAPWTESKLTEIVDIAGNPACNISDFPNKVYDGVGGLFKGNVPFYCGGYSFNNNGGQTDECFALDPSGQWIQAGNMLEPREFAASLMLDQGKTLWVTGGYRYDPDHPEATGGHVYSETTEALTIPDIAGKEFRFQETPRLPNKVMEHCLVQLNDTAAMLIGGHNFDKITMDTTYILDIDIQPGQEVLQYQHGPRLNSARYGHTCGLLTKPGDGSKQVVVVAGGFNSTLNRTVSTELWTVGSEEWTAGPDLPVENKSGAGLSTNYGKAFLLIGGYKDKSFKESINKIYKLEFKNGDWKWSKMDTKLQVGRGGHVAFYVPDSLGNCTKLQLNNH